MEGREEERDRVRGYRENLDRLSDREESQREIHIETIDV